MKPQGVHGPTRASAITTSSTPESCTTRERSSCAETSGDVSQAIRSELAPHRRACNDPTRPTATEA